MRPAKDETVQRDLCDQILHRATELMSESGAPVEMILDRLITLTAAQAVASFGRTEAVNMLRFAADRVENGLMQHLEASKN